MTVSVLELGELGGMPKYLKIVPSSGLGITLDAIWGPCGTIDQMGQPLVRPCTLSSPYLVALKLCCQSSFCLGPLYSMQERCSSTIYIMMLRRVSMKFISANCWFEQEFNGIHLLKTR